MNYTKKSETNNTSLLHHNQCFASHLRVWTDVFDVRQSNRRHGISPAVSISNTTGLFSCRTRAIRRPCNRQVMNTTYPVSPKPWRKITCKVNRMWCETNLSAKPKRGPISCVRCWLFGYFIWRYHFNSKLEFSVYLFLPIKKAADRLSLRLWKSISIKRHSSFKSTNLLTLTLFQTH